MSRLLALELLKEKLCCLPNPRLSTRVYSLRFATPAGFATRCWPTAVATAKSMRRFWRDLTYEQPENSRHYRSTDNLGSFSAAPEARCARGCPSHIEDTRCPSPKGEGLGEGNHTPKPTRANAQKCDPQLFHFSGSHAIWTRISPSPLPSPLWRGSSAVRRQASHSPNSVALPRTVSLSPE